MKLKLKKINVLKLGFFLGLLYSLLSIFIVTIMGLLLTVTGQPFSWFVVFVAPIIYGIGGFIGGLIMGSLYNLISNWIGGLEFDFEEIKNFSE